MRIGAELSRSRRPGGADLAHEEAGRREARPLAGGRAGRSSPARRRVRAEPARSPAAGSGRSARVSSSRPATPMGSKETRKRNWDKENKEKEQSIEHITSKDHDSSKRRKTNREDYHCRRHQEHIGQTGHDTCNMKTKEHNQHTWTQNSDNKDRSHWSHNRGKSHEQHCDNRRKHITRWRQEEFENSKRKGYIHNERSTGLWNDRWCPEKLTPERGDTKGLGLNVMNDNSSFEHMTTDWSLDRWCPERYEKEDQWPSYNKEVEKMQHRHKGSCCYV